MSDDILTTLPPDCWDRRRIDGEQRRAEDRAADEQFVALSTELEQTRNVIKELYEVLPFVAIMVMNNLNRLEPPKIRDANGPPENIELYWYTGRDTAEQLVEAISKGGDVHRAIIEEVTK